MNAPGLNLSLPLGDFTHVDRVCPLAVIATDAVDGAQIRALHLVVSEAVEPDGFNYWILQLGVIDEAGFRPTAPDKPFPRGFVANRRIVVPYDHPALFARGDMPAVRFRPTGEAPPLAGVSVTPEWGTLSSKRGA